MIYQGQEDVKAVRIKASSEDKLMKKVEDFSNGKKITADFFGNIFNMSAGGDKKKNILDIKYQTSTAWLAGFLFGQNHTAFILYKDI